MSTYAPLVGRILMGLLFLVAGISKFNDLTGTAGYIASVGLPFPLVLAVLAAVVEVGGGALLILGLKTRYAAGALTIFAVTVNALFHSDFMGTQQVIFLKDMAIVGGLLYVATYGSGTYALDTRKARGM